MEDNHDKPEEQPSEDSQFVKEEPPEIREISAERLERILNAHLKWLESDGKKGERALLYHTNLRGARLEGANLEGAYLEGARLQGARLEGANLEGAYLREANIQDARLWHTTLRDTSLQDANLGGAKGLQGGQLAGADVSGAKLPEDVAKFEEGLKVIEEASRNARKLFFAMLSACAYALLTIATTTDVRLLTNSASSPLPIIRTEIPIVWFYIAAPLILLCLYFYFHLYMQRLWEGLAELPAIFPDGRSLDKKAYPWLLTGLVRAYVLHLKVDRPPLSHFQEWISIFLAWIFMPGTLICFWLRYLPRQDWFGTALHIGSLVVAVWAGVLFYRLAVGTLRWDEIELSLWKKPLKKIMTYKRSVLPVRLGLILFLLSLGTINGVATTASTFTGSEFVLNDVRTWVPYVFERLGFIPFANFREKDVSTKPENWSGKPEEIKGAPLKGRNLRYVDAYRAFLVSADFRGADLRGGGLQNAKLQKANLFRANLQEANLQEANLEYADLEGANLWKANLWKAKLTGANLREAYLRRANLELAILWEVNLEEANLEEANLHATNLWKANLQGANLDGANLVLATLREANLRGTSLKGAELNFASFSEANLEYADLEGANLERANLQEANLEEANLAGANLQGATNLTLGQLSEVNSLYEAKLDPELMEEIKKNYPRLLEKPED